MSVIAQKSNENFDAVDLLISEGFNAPVVHCAYYSSLQLMIHYFFLYTGKTQEEVEKEAKGNNSHNFYLSGYVKEIKKLDARNASIFYNFFGRFKRLRNIADYKNLEITESDLATAKDYAEKVRRFLNLVGDHGKCENIHNF